ncbi:MAG: hypothetical protein AAF389_20645 [Gemmatimonadota bacterium]
MSRPTIHIHGDRVELRDQESTVLAPRDVDAASTWDRRLFEPMAERLGRGREVVLQLHPPVVQLRTLSDVPRLKEADLIRLVAESHDRFFRPSEGRPAVGASVHKSNGSAPVVVAATLPQEELLGLEEVVSEVGLRISAVTATDAADRAVPIRTPHLARRRRRRDRASLGGAVVLAALGWLAAGGVYIGDLLTDRAEILAERDALAGPMGQLEEIDRQIQAFEPVALAMQRLSAPAHWVTPTLQMVVDALPADAHLHVFSLDASGVVQITAHSADPLGVLDALSAVWPGSVRVQRAPSADGPADEIALSLEVADG